MMLVSALLAMLALGFLVDGLAAPPAEDEPDDAADPGAEGARALSALDAGDADDDPEADLEAGADRTGTAERAPGPAAGDAASGAEPDGSGAVPQEAAAVPQAPDLSGDDAAPAGEGGEGAPHRQPPILPFDPETWCIVVLAPPEAELDLAVDETAALLLLDGAPLAALDPSGPFGPGDIRLHGLPGPGG